MSDPADTAPALPKETEMATSSQPRKTSTKRATSTASKRAATKTTPAKTTVTAREAVARVLADGTARPSKEVTSAAAAIATLSGKTPEASIRALLSTEAKKADGLVVRTKAGEYQLRAGA